MTDNHNYETPSAGTTDWHVPINKNFERMDADIEVRDVEANLNQYTPRSGSKFMATDTERIFVADGDNWLPVKSSGQDPVFSTVRTKTVNGEVHAEAFAGSGLASKVENALEWTANNTDGKGRVRVTAPDGGGRWTWDKDLVVDPTEYGGIQLDIDSKVAIEYPGDGIALTLDTTWANQNSEFHINSVIRGGQWYATGSSPEGCIRLEDSYRTLVKDVEIYDFMKDDPLTNGRETFGVQLRNVDGWTESTLIRDCRFGGTSIAIDTEPAAYNSGNGSGSFHGTVIDNNRFEVSNIGLRARGGFDYSTVQNNSFFSKGTNDDAWHIQLGGSDTNLQPSLDGTVISGNKHEDPGGSVANDADDVAYRLAPNFFDFKQPTLINNKIYLSDSAGGVGAGIKNDSGAKRLFQFNMSENKVIFQNILTGVTGGAFYDDLADEFNWYGGRFNANVAGSSSEPAVKIGGNGAGIFVNGDGNVVAVDENGDKTTLT